MKILKRVTVNPWPDGHIAAVVIRDDDISYFTPPYKIEEIYDRAWRQQFKISLGVIPNIKAIDDPLVPPKYRKRSSLYNLQKNENLVKYLKENLIARKIDIAQHGYTHEMLHGLPEFCIHDANEIKTRLETGRKILEESFSTEISVFIAPWNTVSKQTLNILNEQNLALCGKKDRKHVHMSFNGFSKILNAAHRIFTQYFHSFHSSSKRVVRSSGVIQLHPSVDWWSNSRRAFVFNEKCIRQAKEEFEKTLTTGDMFCLLNHYWGYYGDWQDELDPKMLDAFYSVLNFLDGQEVWKTTLSEIVDWIRRLEKIEFQISAGKVTLKSPTTIRGVTIKGEGCTLIPASEADVKVQKDKGSAFLIYEQLNADENEVAYVENV